MSGDGSAWPLMLRDIVFEVRQEIETPTAADDAFESGRRFGLWSMLELLSTQATAFGLDPADVGLGDLKLPVGPNP